MAADDVKKEEQNIDLRQLANEVLVGKVYEPVKERNARTDDHNNGGQSNNEAHGSIPSNGNGKVKHQGEQQNKEKKNIIYLQKHYSARDRLLAEAVLIGNKPYYLFSRQDNSSHIEIASSIELSETEILRPPELSGYINMPYRFDSETHLKDCIEKAKQERLDSLYRKNKVIWRKYFDADDFHISISALDEIYSYFQQRIGLTHYLFFTGGNNSGKSNNLTKIHYTAYRNMIIA
jgi:hypothetical protein